MMDGATRVEVTNVEVLDAGSLVMKCRVGEKILFVPPLRLLPGTTIRRIGDNGKLVLEQDLARELGLV